MKQVKIAYSRCKKKIPNRPPDEIDFGLGFRSALRWIEHIVVHESNGPSNPKSLIRCIDEELL